MGGMRICVTGGAGFLGRSLVGQLLEMGHEVNVVDNFSRNSKGFLEETELLTYCRMDIRNSPPNSPAFDVDALFHLAAINGTRNFYDRPGEVLDVGIRGMIRVLDARQHFGIDDFVLYSSSEVYQDPRENWPTDETVPLSIPDPLNPRYSYGVSKIASEMLALHSGVFERPLIIRPHNVYGPGMGYDHVIPELIMKAKRDEVVTLEGDGWETRSFCYVSDFTTAVVRLWDCETGIFHVGSREEVSIQDLAERIVFRVSPGKAIVAGERKKGGVLRRCPDVSKLQTAIGSVPSMTLDLGLDLTVSWYLENEKNWPTRTG